MDASAEDIINQLRRKGTIDDATIKQAQEEVAKKVASYEEVDGVVSIPMPSAPKIAEGEIKMRLGESERVWTLRPVSEASMMFLLRKLKGGDVAALQGTLDILARSMGEEQFMDFQELVEDPDSGVGPGVIEHVFTVLIERSAKRPTAPPSVSSDGRKKTKPGSGASASKRAGASKT